MSSTAVGEVAKAHAARLFFVRGLSKSEIAERLGVSRFKVARMLEQARAEGIVRVEIREPLAMADDLAAALESRFGLTVAAVVRGPDPRAVPHAAADWLVELLGPDDVLGVAWGSTLHAVLESLPEPAAAPRAVVQTCGAVAGIETGSGPFELAWRFAERLGGRLYPLPAPAVNARAGARADLVANPAVGPTIAMFDQVTLALVGVGALAGDGPSSLLTSGALPAAALARLRRRGAVGDLLVHVFDARGRVLDSGLDGRVLALPLSTLARVPRVMAVAGGEGKAAAISGALRTGLIDVLVTDEANARAALEGPG